MRVIIICAGKEERWDKTISERKHFVVIEGERLIDRTVRLVNAIMPNAEVFVVGLDSRYEIEGSSLYIPELNYEANADADKFLSSKELWSKEDRTVVLYGDVYFSMTAMSEILTNEEFSWVLFGRAFGSVLTGKMYGECFAQSFMPEMHELHEQKLHEIAQMFKEGRIARCGGWEHYQMMVADAVSSSVVLNGNFINIDDFTEDFDTAEDFNNWLKGRKRLVASTVLINTAKQPNIVEKVYEEAVKNGTIHD